MSVSYIPEPVKRQLWAQSAGCCQYENCAKPLYLDTLTKVEFNTSYIAHIIADQPDGPRGHKELSPKLKCSIDNLMLLCDEHHRLVDKVQVKEHPAERLIEMKRLHEERISLVTNMTPDKRSHIILYGANIGQHGSPLTYREACSSILSSGRYPAHNSSINLGLQNSVHSDDTEQYWLQQLEQLQGSFNQKVAAIKANHEIQHFSLFGLAPMPLLIKLGTLLSDIYDVDVYQRHREPVSWAWQESALANASRFVLTPPGSFEGPPALNISLSATITNDRIIKVLGENASIWTLSHETPHNDFLKTKLMLSEFRKVMRSSFDKIKQAHGQGKTLAVFPAMPVSASIEFGRVWMPKADMPLVIYDQNSIVNSFIKTVSIN